MVVLDTNVIIDFLEGREKVAEVVGRYKSSELATTFVNQYELLKYRTRSRMEESLKNLKIYQSSVASVEFSANAYKELKEKGSIISDNDLLIFGLCLANDEMLITRDQDFKKLKSDIVMLI